MQEKMKPGEREGMRDDVLSYDGSRSAPNLHNIVGRVISTTSLGAL